MFGRMISIKRFLDADDPVAVEEQSPAVQTAPMRNPAPALVSDSDPFPVSASRVAHVLAKPPAIPASPSQSVPVQPGKSGAALQGKIMAAQPSVGEAAETKRVRGEEKAALSKEEGLLASTLAAYRTALDDFGESSVEVCPALGEELKQGLHKIARTLEAGVGEKEIVRGQETAHTKMEAWTQKAIEHNQKKTDEVKELLLVMARTAGSVGERDKRCAKQITEVTSRLQAVANLDDLTQMRKAIERTASELKTSIDRMTSEGSEAIKQLKSELTVYQNKLEEAEKMASRDSLTGLVVRRCVENQIQRRIEAKANFCVAILDIDGFKQVNDTYGHLVGDELLKQFAGELKSRSRSNDLIGRWGGDEFILVIDLDLEASQTQIDRLREWICGNYTLKGAGEVVKLEVSASIGLAERKHREDMKSLIHRADEAMYRHKSAAKAARGAHKA